MAKFGPDVWYLNRITYTSLEFEFEHCTLKYLFPNQTINRIPRIRIKTPLCMAQTLFTNGTAPKRNLIQLSNGMMK